MAHSFTCQTCNQDAVVSQNSSMLLILSALYVNGDRNRPAITVTDKTYGRINHFKPLHSVVELLMMAPNERALAVEFNKKHKIPPMAVEYSFNNQGTKFCHIDDSLRFRITQNGRSNRQRLLFHCL
jgi:hypothetical protein